jgi:hypothetical protein
MHNEKDKVYEIGDQPEYTPKQKSQNQKENITKSMIQHRLSAFESTRKKKTDKHVHPTSIEIKYNQANISQQQIGPNRK